MTSQPDAKIDV